MIKKINVILVLICFISLVKTSIILIKNKNIYNEKHMSFIGTIVGIQKNKDKIVYDIKGYDKYRITLYDLKDDYKFGDKVYVNGNFITPSCNTVFNLFNYRNYLLSKNIKMISDNVKIKLYSKNNNFFYNIKNAIYSHVNKYKSSRYLKAFILADSSKIEDDVMNAYRNIGISHLLAISGMHVGVFLFFFNHILKGNKYKNIIIILFLLLFLFITGFPDSLLRCVTYFILNMINKKLKLNISNSNVLILCAFILLFINPYLIYSIGFLFSVIITYFIILVSPYLKNKRFILKTFIMSLVSFLASIPILSSNFFKVNLLSPFLNIIFIPIISFIIFPLGLITFLFPFLDELYLILINILEYMVLFIDKIKIFSFVIAKPNIIMIIAYYASLYLAIKVNKKYIIIFILVFLINLNMRFLIFNPSITFLDVGQGDSTIIIFPFGKTVLVDTGGNYLSKSSIVENKTIPYLNSLGINKIDLVILTHGDYDHVGEFKNLINNIKIGKVLINKGKINEIEKDIIKNISVEKVKGSYNFNSYNLLFLNDKIYDDENENSIVIYINIKNKNILLMGDADKKVEKSIIKEYNLPKMDILKVGHHGSKTSSDVDFIKKINPSYSVISVGKNNRYGHPNKEVLDLLSNTNILRTDKEGSIKFVFKQNMVNKLVCKPYIIVER